MHLPIRSEVHVVLASRVVAGIKHARQQWLRMKVMSNEFALLR